MAASTTSTQHQAATSQHLSDHQVAQLRARLTDALEQQRRQVAESDEQVETLTRGGDDTGYSRELARAAAERAREAVGDIETALGRLEDGSYGTCESCARPIPFERLEVIPQARQCVACPPAAGTGR